MRIFKYPDKFDSNEYFLAVKPLNTHVEAIQHLSCPAKHTYMPDIFITKQINSIMYFIHVGCSIVATAWLCTLLLTVKDITLDLMT
jgi:hypothetical protein